MKIITTHPGIPSHMVRRAVAWFAGEIGLHRRQGLTIQVSYRQRKPGQYQPSQPIRSRSVEVWIGRDQTFPVRIDNNRQEADRTADDVIELFVRRLAHELEHARTYQTANCGSPTGGRLNSKPRVRAIDYRVLQAFRQRREELLAELGRHDPVMGIDSDEGYTWAIVVPLDDTLAPFLGAVIEHLLADCPTETPWS